MPSLTLYVTMTRSAPTECPECPDCLFDSLYRFTFVTLKDTGVDESIRIVCPRCRDNREDR